MYIDSIWIGVLSDLYNPVPNEPIHTFFYHYRNAQYLRETEQYPSRRDRSRALSGCLSRLETIVSFDSENITLVSRRRDITLPVCNCMQRVLAIKRHSGL
jgi:hypothetical protein